MADNENKEMQLRRLALLLMAQIPDDPEDALKVLAYASELVSGFMVRGPEVEPKRNRLHSLRLVENRPSDPP